MNIEKTMKLSELHLNNANPRFIKDERFKKLMQSIKDFPKMMALRPIIVDTDGTILGGNMRFRAIQELGYTEIPTLWVKKASELTDEEKKRFIIEDNIPFGEWDWDMLADEWDSEELGEWGLDVWQPSEVDVDSFFEDEKESDKSHEIKIEVFLPEEKIDQREEVCKKLAEIVKEYRGRVV